MAIVTLDDRDVTITYAPPVGWLKGGSKNENNSTTSYTVIAGSTATVKFTGTSIGVYGTIGASKGALSVAPISSYSIDGGAAVLFRATQATAVQYKKLFFQSPTLKDGAHTLTISHPAISDPFFLDFFQVNQVPPTTTTAPVVPPVNATTIATTTLPTTNTTTPLTPTSITMNTTPIPTVTPTTSSTTPLVPQTVTVTSVQAASTTSSANTTANSNGSDLANADNTSAAKSTNAGAIAGGVIGAILALFLIGFGFIIWRRRRRERRNSMISSNFWNTNARSAPVDFEEEVSVVPIKQAKSKPFASSSPPQSPRVSNGNAAPMMVQAPALNNQSQVPRGSYVPQMAQVPMQAPPPNPYAAPRYPGGYAPAPPPVHPGYGAGYVPSPPPPNPYGAPEYGPGPGYDQGYVRDAYAHEQAYGHAHGHEQAYGYGHEQPPYAGGGGGGYASPSQLAYGRR